MMEFIGWIKCSFKAQIKFPTKETEEMNKEQKKNKPETSNGWWLLLFFLDPNQL